MGLKLGIITDQLPLTECIILPRKMQKMMLLIGASLKTADMRNLIWKNTGKNLNSYGPLKIYLFN